MIHMPVLQYILSIDGFVNGIIALIFGFLVLKNNKKNTINQTLFLLTLTTGIWSFGYWRWLSVYDSAETALFWARTLSIGSTLIPVFYFHWVSSLLDLNKKNKVLIIISYALALFFLLFTYAKNFIVNVEPVAGYFLFWPKAGYLYTVYLIILYVLPVFYSFYLLIKYYKSSFGLKKAQIRYVLFGSVLGFGGGATNFFLWYDIPILPLGNFLVITYPILFAYSIIKHRLMDIKFVFRKSSIYLSTLITVIIISFIARYILIFIFKDYDYWTTSVVIIIAILIYPKLRETYYHIANKYFFSSLYEPQKVIAELSERLRGTLNVSKIYEDIYDALNNSFHLKAFGILSYDSKGDTYYVKYNQGFEVGDVRVFEGNPQLNRMFIEKNKSIIVEEIKNVHYNAKTKKTIDLLVGLNVDILTPLKVKDEIIGLIALGSKESGDMYNDDDLQMLEIIGAQAAIAIENAVLYEEAKNFNVKLENEVERATIELRDANEKLKKLDEAKSEFISIASHQLRTPLTVIKGYISMMLEGNFGELTAPEEDSLTKVYESNERLINLVENLLNISRIESGRLQYNFELLDLGEIVNSVAEELAGTAVKKGLKFEYKKPKRALTKTVIDDEKVRQVVMNLVDNAIKYTKQGSVTVTLNKKADDLVFCVSDSGMGISKDDLPNLFKKFSRGTGTSLVHTEGTGLGLYVADQMIRAHKGKVWAESRGEGKGSKFCFKLPIRKKIPKSS